MIEVKFKDPDVQDAYNRGIHLAEKFGEDLLAIDPRIYERIPSALSQKIGLGAALGLWKGIHSLSSESPFLNTWPIQGFFKAGRDWYDTYRLQAWTSVERAS